jgi:hypothetical protein
MAVQLPLQQLVLMSWVLVARSPYSLGTRAAAKVGRYTCRLGTRLVAEVGLPLFLWVLAVMAVVTFLYVRVAVCWILVVMLLSWVAVAAPQARVMYLFPLRMLDLPVPVDI